MRADTETSLYPDFVAPFEETGAGVRRFCARSLVVNGKLSVRNIALREGRTLCLRSAHSPRFSCEEVLPRPGWVQRLARFCTRPSRKNSATRHLEGGRSVRFHYHYFRRSRSLWPTSAPESELLIST